MLMPFAADIADAGCLRFSPPLIRHYDAEPPAYASYASCVLRHYLLMAAAAADIADAGCLSDAAVTPPGCQLPRWPMIPPPQLTMR